MDIDYKIYILFLAMCNNLDNTIFLNKCKNIEFKPSIEVDDMITIDEAIRIGKEELKRHNYSGLKKELNIEADEDNSRWKKYIECTPSMKKSLKGTDPNSKDYYAVYFGPKELQLGGDAWVLVNRKSGKVIHLFFGR